MSDYTDRVAKDLKVQKRVFHNGYRAALKGQPRDANPHLLTYEVLATKWNEGWDAAQEDLNQIRSGLFNL